MKNQNEQQEGTKKILGMSTPLNTTIQVESKVEGLLDLEKIAKEKGYEKIIPLGIWYLGVKSHEGPGEYTQEHWHTYELLGQDMQKMKKITLQNGKRLSSPKYIGNNAEQIIITHGMLSPVFKENALFDTKGNFIEIIDNNGLPVKKPKLGFDTRNGKVVLLKKSEIWPTMSTLDIRFYMTNIIDATGIVSNETETISEGQIQTTSNL